MKAFIAQMLFVVCYPLAVIGSFYLAGFLACRIGRFVEPKHTVKPHQAGVAIWLLFCAVICILIMTGVMDDSPSMRMPDEYYEHHSPRF